MHAGCQFHGLSTVARIEAVQCEHGAVQPLLVMYRTLAKQIDLLLRLRLIPRLNIQQTYARLGIVKSISVQFLQAATGRGSQYPCIVRGCAKRNDCAAAVLRRLAKRAGSGKYVDGRCHRVLRTQFFCRAAREEA